MRYGSQMIENEKKQKEIVCGFLNQMDSNRANELKSLITKYEGRYVSNIEKPLSSLSREIIDLQKKLNEFFFYNKTERKNNINTKITEKTENIAIINNDKALIDSAYNDFNTYFENHPLIKQDKWFKGQVKLHNVDDFTRFLYNNCLITQGGKKYSRKSSKKGKSKNGKSKNGKSKKSKK